MMSPRPWPLAAALLLTGAWVWSEASRPVAIGQEQDKPAVARPKAPAVPSEIASPASSPAIAPTPTSEPPPEPASTPPSLATSPEGSAEEEVEDGGIPPGMAELFPIGRVFQGVRIPSYSGDSLGSVIHSQYMKRSDDEHLEMEMLEIVIYTAGKADTRILTDRAIFDTVAKTLRSTTPAKIVQEDVEMRGDRLIFDSTSRIGHLSGNVKTLILNADQLRNPGGPSKQPPSDDSRSNPE